MIIKEIKILSEALWESIKSDLNFFSPIQSFVKKLSESTLTDEDSIDDAILFGNKIEDFFEKYRKKPNTSRLYFPHRLISANDDSVKKINHLLNKLKSLGVEELKMEFTENKIKSVSKGIGDGKIFIGHGRSKLWARLKVYIDDELGLDTLTFEDESRTSESIVPILEEFLEQCSFAILIMTSEDETAVGSLRARQNVIHEAGLFQGRLGFDKVIILKQNGIEEFSNIAGLQYIPFLSEDIEGTFYELRRKFKKMGMIS